MTSIHKKTEKMKKKLLDSEDGKRVLALKSQKRVNYQKETTITQDIDFNERLQREYGLSMINMNMNWGGNGLFRTICYQLSDFKNGDRFDSYRKETVSFIASHEDYFRPLIEEEECEDYETYITIIQKDRRWAGPVEIYAAAQCLRLVVDIFPWNAPMYKIRCEPANNLEGRPLRIVRLSFHGGRYYNSVLPMEIVQSTDRPAITVDSHPSLFELVSEDETRAALAEQVETVLRASSTKASRAEVLMALEMVDDDLQEAIDLLRMNMDAVKAAATLSPSSQLEG